MNSMKSALLNANLPKDLAVADYKHDERQSHQPTDKLKRIYSQYWDIKRMKEVTDRDLQKAGVDHKIEVKNADGSTDVIYTDEKNRKSKTELDSVLLELVSVCQWNYETKEAEDVRALGWTVDPKKETDYFCTLVPLLGKAILFDAKQVRELIEANLDTWKKQARKINPAVRYPCLAKNDGYQSVNILVPLAFLDSAIVRTKSGGIVADYF